MKVATQFPLVWVGWPNGDKLASTRVQIWSRPKLAQVNACARQAWQNGVANRPKVAACICLRVCLARVLDRKKTLARKLRWKNNNLCSWPSTVKMKFLLRIKVWVFREPFFATLSSSQPGWRETFHYKCTVIVKSKFLLTYIHTSFIIFPHGGFSKTMWYNTTIKY